MNLHIRQATPDDLPQVLALYSPTLPDESLGFERHGYSFLIEI
jgi:hypothetical protein